jgi:hypothetical protein
MTDFWNFEQSSTGEFEMGGGDIAPIPAETSCLAAIDEAKWDEKDGARYISLRWNVLQPAEYKNRKVFQKLWVADADPMAKDAEKKRDKAKRMLAAIDQNAGGKLRAAGVEPTETSLGIALINKPMVIKVMQWKIESNGETKTGNWIGAVSAKKGAAPVKTEDAPF